MMERVGAVVTLVALVALMAFWFDQYVGPKDTILSAAQDCAAQTNSPGWAVCLNQAESKYGTDLVALLGY